jgi:hypothetical protein
MEGFSQNAYEYILEKCVGLGNIFLASTKRSYVAFHPFAFQGETQKNSKNNHRHDFNTLLVHYKLLQ